MTIATRLFANGNYHVNGSFDEITQSTISVTGNTVYSSLFDEFSLTGKFIVTDSLVLSLDAAQPESYPGSGTTWTDLSGNGNNGTLVNGPAFNSENGGSIDFDGTDDRGTFTSPITSTSSQTYEIWLKGVPGPSAAGGFYYAMHNNGSATTPTNIGSSYMTIGYTGTGQTLAVGELFACFNGVFANMGTGVIGTATRVRQIVLTWDGATQIAYVDGVQRVSQALSTTPQNFSTTTSFGDYRASINRPLDGNIYCIRVYSKALSATEVLQNFNALRGRYGI